MRVGMFPKPEDTKAEISCRAAKGVILFLRREHGPHVLEEVFARADLPVEYVNEGSNWMSFAAFNRLLETMVEVTGDSASPFRAGAETADPSTFGPVRVMGQRFLSVEGVFRMMAMHNRFFVKICDWSLLAHSTGHVRIQIRYHPGYRQTRWNCDNIRGHLSSIPVWQNLAPAKVTHSDCILHGAETCIYDVDWAEQPSHSAALLGGIGGILLGLTGLAMPPALRAAPWLWGTLTVALGVTVAGLCTLHSRLRILRRQHLEEADSLEKTTELNQIKYSDLQAQIEMRTRELTDTMTELRASRAEALRRERDAAIGVLASGMAHDMNSPLNAINLSIQAIEEGLSPESQLAPLVANAKRASGRCKRLVADLLTFSREPRMTDDANLADIAQRCMDLFKTEISPDIHIDFDPSGNHVPLPLDKAQLQQAILNLLGNAADAMEGKGNIHIRLRTKGSELALEIEDEGPGMSDDVKQQAFEPFFTTKRSGSGLGLAIVRRLVQRNEGRMEMESTPGTGTTFRLLFPVKKANGQKHNRDDR